jgi:hypothetical protein
LRRPVAAAGAAHYIECGTKTMRAEIATIVDDIKQSVGLLRRHL